MNTNVKKRIAYVFLFAILTLSIFFLLIGTSFITDVSGHELPIGEEELPPVQEVDPSVLSIDKADSPIAGRTSWANESRPLGLVIYLNDVSFELNQVHLQNGMTAESLAKITFTRGDKSATPALICASKDGSYGNKSYFAFFFAGELASETVNEYQEGDTFEIAEGCILKCNEGSFCFDGAVKYIYDGGQWSDEEPVPEPDPSVLSIDKADSPIAGRTSWANESRPLGLVIYLNDVSFELNQVHLQNGMTAESLAKITFTRGDKSATPALICASKDGSYGNKSYFAFFFAGELASETVNEYQEGDTFEIAEGCILKCNEGSFCFDGAVKYIYDGEEWVTELIDPVALSIDKADSPVAGKTSWANESRPLGLVIYLNDVSFELNQVHLQNGMTAESLAKITFTRGDKSATPALICASKDGSYGNKSYFAFFFAGELASETVNEYQEGDTFEIAEGCILKCNEGSFYFDGAVKYIYDGKQWTAEEEIEPEIIDYSTTDVPVDNVTNWGEDKEYVGIVLYNKGWTFEGGQAHLEVKPWTKTERVTFIRGNITEECVLIAAGKDGKKNLCYCSYFFGGELTETSLQTGDKVNIKGDFAFTTKEGRYSYGKDLEFIFDGEQWIDTSVNDQSLTYITYITEPKDDGDRILFNLKTTTIFGTDDEVTDSLKQSILINGVSVSDLGSKAEINYSFSKIVLSVEKSALILDDYDMIVIKKGAILKGDEDTGLKLRDDETFRYSHTLKRTDLIPDHNYYGSLSSYAIIDNIEVAGNVSSSKINGVTYELSHSVWIHFKWAAKFNYDTFYAHLSAEESVLNGMNEKLCYEYQRLGLFYSVTDLLKVNGKSLYEWMITDAKNGKPNCFKVEYLPYEIDTGRVLRIVVADESALDIGVGFDQTIEFKQGFINPGLGEVQKDSFYSMKEENAEINKKFDMGYEQESGGSDSSSTADNSENTEQKKSGCGGEIRIEYSLISIVCALLLCIFVLIRRSGRRWDK